MQRVLFDATRASDALAEQRILRHDPSPLILNLTACLVFLAVIIAGAVIVWRKLRLAGEAAAGELVCVACRTPARLLSPDSFVCPGCHEDVRLLGIAFDRPKRLTRPFWQVVIFTAALCVVALVTTGVLSTKLHENYLSIQSTLRFSGEAYQTVDVLFKGRRRANGPLHGELYADMFLKDGQVVTLVIESPSRHYRLIDNNGKEQSSQENSDQQAALRWLSMAGLDPSDPRVREQAVWMKTQFDDFLNGNNRTPFGPPDARPHYTGGGGGSSWSGGDPELLMQFSVIGWSLIWLAGLTLIVRPRAAAKSAKQEAAG